MNAPPATCAQLLVECLKTQECMPWTTQQGGAGNVVVDTDIESLLGCDK